MALASGNSEKAWNEQIPEGNENQQLKHQNEFVRFLLVDKNLSHGAIQGEIKNYFPDFNGCSLRSLKRFCSEHGIKKEMPVSDEAIDVARRMCYFRRKLSSFYSGL